MKKRRTPSERHGVLEKILSQSRDSPFLNICICLLALYRRTKKDTSEECSSNTHKTKAELNSSHSSKEPHMNAFLATRRLNLISATAKAGRDKSLDFDIRVRCARAAAIGAVLFGTPQSTASDGTAQLYSPLAAINTLKLPTVKEVGPLLDTYRANVEWMCNVVIVDLNRSRIENFLNWYHSNPQTLPADPPLIPLILVILALAIQARRTIRHSSGHSERVRKKHSRKTNDQIKTEKASSLDDDEARPGGAPYSRAQSPHDEFIAVCSSEKELLETAGRCIDALQIACPSNWASAFSAPLDLVRANLLRGLWHLSELHLQFAGGCFAVTVRLAHAAALNRDTRHWQSMGKEEAQARRNMFWNVASLEVLHSNRVIQPPTILPGSYDTQFPHDHEALLGLYRRAGLIEPFVVDGRRSNFRVHPISRANFDFHLTRFQLTDVLIKGGGTDGFNKDNHELAEGYERWKEALPESLKSVLEKNELGVLGGELEKDLGQRNNVESDPEAQTRYLQDALLQMISLSTSIQIHRPQVDETGRWRPPEGQAQRSLELCIESAQRLIWLIWSIVTRDPGPPYVLYNFCIFYCFQAAIIIAIQSALSGPSQQSNNEPSTFAVLARPSLDKAVRTLDLISSKGGLRLVAEQASRYASTLREIDLAQKRSKSGEGRDTTKVNEMPNVPTAAIGAPPPIIVEGNGKTLGGQGYPSRHASRAASPTTSFEVANQFEDMNQSQPIGFDFNDLQVFPPSSQSNLSTSTDYVPQLQAGVYVDRPFHEVYDIAGGNAAAATVYSKDNSDVISSSHHSTGLDLLAAQVDQARTVQSNPWSQQQHSSLGQSNTSDTSSWPPTFSSHPSNGQTAFSTTLSSWNKDAMDQSAGQQIVVQPASAPALETLGETFATDWTEWERAVERLLHNDR